MDKGLLYLIADSLRTYVVWSLKCAIQGYLSTIESYFKSFAYYNLETFFHIMKARRRT